MFKYTIPIKTNCLDLFAHIRIALDESQKHGVYLIPCECGLVYIGETGRNLSKCLKEHKTNCEKAELDKSNVAKHAWTYDHRIKWDEANILAIDSHRFSRKMRESIEIELKAQHDRSRR